jgi:hypothetical protein
MRAVWRFPVGDEVTRLLPVHSLQSPVHSAGAVYLPYVDGHLGDEVDEKNTDCSPRVARRESQVRKHAVRPVIGVPGR